MQKNILIIGLGNIGFKHFESLLTIKTKLNLFVCESDISKHNKIKNFFKINNINIHNLKINRRIEKFNFVIDVAIIATTSNARKKIIDDLIRLNIVRNIIIEKVAFNNLEEYLYITKLLNSKKIKSYVNFPRREYSSYQDLKKSLKRNQLFSLSNIGFNWGLASNSLHIIDLFSFLTDENIFLLNSNLSKKIFKSKRKNFMEFRGSIKYYTKKGNLLNLEDIDFHEKSDSIYGGFKIETAKEDYIIFEKQEIMLKIIKKPKKIEIKKINFKVELQSKLTAKIILNIFSNKKIHLPSLQNSYIIHKEFIGLLANHLKRIKKNRKLIIT